MNDKTFTLEPREFQINALSVIANCDSKRICLAAPTGAGKAILLMYLAEQALNEGKKVLLLVDRITLVSQLSKTAIQCGLKHNLIQGNNFKLINADFTIASIQSYYRMSTKFMIDLILIDECHTQYKRLTHDLLTYPGKAIGVTATPFTVGLGKIYDKLIYAVTADKLTRDGILVKLEPYTFTKINMSGAKTIGGEWTANEIRKRSADILGDVVENYIICAYGKRSIAFCATVEHCYDVAEQFTAKGIPVAVFTSRTTEKDRAQILADFDAKKLLVIISVACLSKGFDKSYIECILDLRPLRKSLAEYVQMIGRGLRAAPGKSSCILLDFSGNLQRFLPDYEEIFFNGINTLDSADKLERIRNDQAENFIIDCPQCNFIPFNHKCINCGWENSIIKRKIITDTKDINKIAIEIKKPKTKTKKKAQTNWVKSIFKKLWSI